MDFCQMLPSLSAALNAIPVPIFIKDCAGRYVGCNGAFEKFIGSSCEKIVGKTVFDFFPRRAAHDLCEREMELLKLGQTHEQETTMIAADSSLRDVVIYRELFTNPAGEAAGVIGVVLDVTQVKKLQEQLRDCSSELELRLKVRTAELTRSYEELIRRNAHYARRYDERSVTGSVGDIPSFSRISGLSAHVAALKTEYEHRVARQVRSYARLCAVKDGYHPRILKTAALLAAAVGKRMHLSRHSLDIIALALDVYDIGKYAMPEEILTKAGKLTPAEMRVVRKHPRTGADAVAAVGPLKDAALCVLSHHERWNGSGYPAGSSKEQIPVEARVLGLIDTYKALSVRRSYRAPLERDEALKVIASCSGVQFDPQVVQVFLDIVK